MVSMPWRFLERFFHAKAICSESNVCHAGNLQCDPPVRSSSSSWMVESLGNKIVRGRNFWGRWNYSRLSHPSSNLPFEEFRKIE
jgi:hypothetical protein